MNKWIGPKVKQVWIVAKILRAYHRHNRLPFGLIQPSYPSTKELHDISGKQNFEQVRLLISAEKTFGKFVLMAFSISLSTFVFGSFFSILIVLAFGGEQFGFVTFTYGLLPFFLACLNFIRCSVTRSGDLLDFGQLLNAFGNT